MTTLQPNKNKKDWANIWKGSQTARLQMNASALLSLADESVSDMFIMPVSGKKSKHLAALPRGGQKKKKTINYIYKLHTNLLCRRCVFYFYSSEKSIMKKKATDDISHAK